MSTKPFDGRLYVADTSAWTRRRHPLIRDELGASIVSGQILGTPIVAMELVFDARDATQVAALEERYSALREAQLDRGVVDAARTAQRELAAIGPLHHRVPIADVLIAAAAAERGAGVLHYDAHFDRLAEVLAFESRWVAEPGSL